MFKATAHITLRPSILDPQGKAIQQALSDLGFGSVEGVRVGKRIELEIDADGPKEAERIAREACEKLLANPVMEDFTVELDRVAA